MNSNLNEIRNIAFTYETPFYYFDETELIDRAKKIKNLLGDIKLCFSIKSNPFLLKSLDSVVDRIEVCSPGEMQICIRNKISPNKILYSGVVRKRAEIETALSYGVTVFTAESIRQLELLNETCTHKVKVLLRLNSGAQFGMSERDIYASFGEKAKFRNLEIMGIHFFAGTQRRNKDFEKQKNELIYINHFIRTLESMGYNIQELEYGPGLPVRLFDSDEEENGVGYLKILKEYLDSLNCSFSITVEMGRYLTTYCGKYVTQILDIKKVNDANYCIIDGGINHIAYAGQVMGMKTPLITHIKNGEGNTEDVFFICGSLCTTGDVLARSINMHSPSIGDYLVFENTGGYSVSEGISLFLSRLLPKVFIRRDNGNMVLIRDSFDTSLLNTGMNLEE